jgi:very-short-patch-repair endonuclease
MRKRAANWRGATPDVSALEETLALHFRAVGLAPVREHKFHPKRQFRFDFAFLEEKIAIECEGGSWVGGSHTRPERFERDCEKYNEAAILGWAVLRFTKSMIDSGMALRQIEQALAAKGFEDDCIKYNSAVLEGWRVWEALNAIEEALK